MNLKENALHSCYDNGSKKEASRQALSANQFSNKECMIMLFGILAMAVIFAEMIFTRDTAFFYEPHKRTYDYR